MASISMALWRYDMKWVVNQFSRTDHSKFLRPCENSSRQDQVSLLKIGALSLYA